ncbi:hypothetical protein RY831_30250 [Noviherbaspirillum sp. CPCC 100848]|uniref:Uncharacterized protein n=1 Tax=Noviherbaspirillum album TaxID=3080276 RepID=A0ABU6JIC6_9BURK|nr:hypothetical protein [Noviherbaspirillum sp. CPCC 100848]MEC4723427.1 hypothetical protein [Noviherbaspirillum sp. CPCC 100848]
MSIWKPPTNFEEWERALVAHFLMVGPNGDASEIRSLEVTATTLANAFEAPAGHERDVENAFRRMLLSDHLLWEALRIGSHRGSTPAAPNFFCYLALTLFIDSLLDGEYVSGAFRSKLANWLQVDYSFAELHGVALMWELLTHWLEKRASEGAPFRRLVLPDPGTWTHIGYSRRLSFPNRKDIRVVERFVNENTSALAHPRVLIREFDRELVDESLSFGLISAFEDFKQSYLQNRRALADDRFWRLLQRVHVSNEDHPFNAWVELVFNENSEFEFLACRDNADEKHVYASLGSALRHIDAAVSANLGAGLRREVIFFRQTGIGRWQAEADLRACVGKVHVAFADRLKATVKEYFGGLVPSGGWLVSASSISKRKVEQGLLNVRLFQPTTETIYRPTLHGGVRVASAWLGRSRYLPSIDADSEDLIVRSDQEDVQLSALSVSDSGELICDRGTDGSYVIEPMLKEHERRSPWRLRFRLVANALPHVALNGSRRQLEPLVDWDSVQRAPMVLRDTGPLQWEQGESRCDDLLEAVYASGAKGWEEADLVRIVQRAAEEFEQRPWPMLRALHDAGVIEPRLRNGWRGRVWTPAPPKIVTASHEEGELLLVEGALCKNLVDELQLCVESEGGQCFRRLGASVWAPVVYGAFGVSARSIGARLGWQVEDAPAAPGKQPLALRKTNRHAELYQVGSTWDWHQKRFVATQATQSTVNLTRRTHQQGLDHDIYRVVQRGRTDHYLSRTSAIIAAYAAGGLTLFRFEGDRLVRDAEDGGLPDLLAATLRRRRLRAAGPIDESYVYPCTEEDAAWLSSLMPGCIKGISKVIVESAGYIISVARRSSGRLRPQWRSGHLKL